MNLVIKLSFILLKLLNFWFFVIPGRFSLLALVGYNLGMYLYFGKWNMDIVRDTLGYNTTSYNLFLLFVGFPMFWSFICCFASAKMTSNSRRGSLNSALDSAIEYRNGQMSVKTPQKAFDILKQTSSLDMMKANEKTPTFEQAIMGFNAKYGNASPTRIFDELTKK